MTKEMTVKDLKMLLDNYPDSMTIGNQFNEDFAFMEKSDDRVILSTEQPIGRCNRCNVNVYPSDLPDYTAYCPQHDENLFATEITK